jgi:hypothetical protein
MGRRLRPINSLQRNLTLWKKKFAAKNFCPDFGFLPGTDVMDFKNIFAEKFSENIGGFFARTTASF